MSLCPGLEKTLQDRLRSLIVGQLAGKQDMQEIAETTDDLSRRKQTYRTEVEDIQDLMEDMKFQLDQARANLRAAVRDWTLDQGSGGRMWTGFRPDDVVLSSGDSCWRRHS